MFAIWPCSRLFAACNGGARACCSSAGPGLCSPVPAGYRSSVFATGRPFSYHKARLHCSVGDPNPRDEGQPGREHSKVEEALLGVVLHLGLEEGHHQRHAIDPRQGQDVGQVAQQCRSGLWSGECSDAPHPSSSEDDKRSEEGIECHQRPGEVQPHRYRPGRHVP